MKIVNVLGGILNIAVVCTMVAIGAFHYSEAAAQTRLLDISQEDRYCLQQNIYFESRNQSQIGQIAVAWVTLNRMEASRYPDTVCDVVWQKKQFSWTHDGKSDQPGTTVLEQRAWLKAGVVAETALQDWANQRTSPIGNATMYHADYVSPYWRSNYSRVTTIDNHIFYAQYPG